jgi:hypothetical protein
VHTRRRTGTPKGDATRHGRREAGGEDAATAGPGAEASP